MMLAAGLDPASTLIAFGLMQVATGLAYRLPVPVQPLKAVAALVITGNIAAGTLYGAGLAIGLVMLALTAFGIIEWLAAVVPKSVIRGIQLGLGIQLSSIALGRYVMAEQRAGLWLAAAAFLIVLLLLGNRRLPAGLLVVSIGVAYVLAFRLPPQGFMAEAGLRLPHWHVPTLAEVLTGFVVLALPQIPLSLGNSILATRQILADWFPAAPVGVRRIGFSYAAMNLVNAFLSGVPTCHGSGGVAGHYAFGARSGGSVMIYGSLFLVAGLFFSDGFGRLVAVFPLPVLGVLLTFEGLTLISLVRDVAPSRVDFSITVLVGLVSAFLPYGYLIGMVAGTLLALAGGAGLRRLPGS